MPTTIVSFDRNPFSTSYETKQVFSLEEMLFEIRGAFEIKADAIAVIKQGHPCGIFVREVEAELYEDRLYEVAAPYPYTLLRPSDRGFNREIMNNFTSKIISSWQ